MSTLYFLHLRCQKKKSSNQLQYDIHYRCLVTSKYLIRHMRGWSLGLDATMEMNQFITWQSHSNSQSWKKRTVSNNTPVMKWERQEKKRQGKHKNGCCVVLVSLLSSQTEVPLKQRWLSVFFTGSMHLLTLAMSFLYCSRWRLLCRTFSLRQFPTEQRTNISLRYEEEEQRLGSLLSLTICASTYFRGGVQLYVGV